MTHEQWKVVADGVNPALALLALAIPLLVGTRKPQSPRLYFIGMGAALLLMYLLRGIEHSDIAVLPRAFGVHYSAHTGFAVVLMTCAALWHRWLALAGVLVLGGYGALMIYQGYHTLGDIVVTAVIVCLATQLVFRLLHSWRSGAELRIEGRCGQEYPR